MGRATVSPTPTGAQHCAPVVRSFDRDRLLVLLDRLHASRFGIVIAPAGSGKTTLMAAWANNRFPGRVVWYGCRVPDAAPGHFAQRLAAALAQSAGAPSSAPHDDLAALAGGVNEPTLLVLDDLHLLSHADAAADLERLLVAASPQLHVLVGTRRMPSLNLAHTELPTPVIVRGEDLRFRAWEVDCLFRDYYAEPLRPDDAAALARRTEGWAAALQLFHLSTAGRGPAERSRAVGALTGRPRYAWEYLSAQVLAGLPDDLGVFLQQTCVFDVVTGRRCDALLGAQASQRKLLELECRQALTTSDDGGRTFRYHDVLRQHLEAALYEELGETLTRTWYRHAADILEAEDAIAEALRARCRAEDWTGVQRLLHNDGARLATDRGTDWVELLPDWLTESDPWVSLAQARRLLDDGRLTAAEETARRAAAQFGDSVGREQCRAVVRCASAWLHGPRRCDPRWFDVIRAATHRDPYGAGAATAISTRQDKLAHGVAMLIAGDCRRAGPVLRQCGSGRDGDSQAGLAARLIIAGFSALIDPQPAAAAALDGVYAEAERGRFTWLARVARGIAVARGGSPGDAEIAEAMAVDCLERGDPWGATFIQAAATLAQLRAGTPSTEAFDQLANKFRLLDAGALEAWARCASALVGAYEQQPDAWAQARAAESFARAAAVPGAQALAYAALAACSANDGEELLRLAETTADAVGLHIYPWRWLAHPGSAHEVAPRPLPDQCSTDSGVSVEWRCLGGFRLLVGGVEVDLSGIRPKPRALLRLLARHAGRGVHREQIADALWGEFDAGVARHNVQVAISTLRRVLELRTGVSGNSLVGRDGEAYFVVLGDQTTCDLDEFDRCVREAARVRSGGGGTAVAALERALVLYSGDLLPQDGAAEWVVDERERYRQRAVAAATTLAELHLQRAEARQAAHAALRGIEIDRCNDASWRALIRAYHECGDQAAERQAHEAYREVLASLGVSCD